MRNRFEWFENKIGARDQINKNFLANIHLIPKLQVVHLNVMNRGAILNSQEVIPVVQGLECLSGQKLSLRYARKSIAGFKLRQGQILGGKCSLRRKLMYEFLEKLSICALPKIRDFQGFDAFLSPSLKLKFLTKDVTKLQLNFSSQSFLLYPELSDFYEIFSKYSGFQITCKGSLFVMGCFFPLKWKNISLS